MIWEDALNMVSKDGVLNCIIYQTNISRWQNYWIELLKKRKLDKLDLSQTCKGGVFLKVKVDHFI